MRLKELNCTYKQTRGRDKSGETKTNNRVGVPNCMLSHTNHKQFLPMMEMKSLVRSSTAYSEPVFHYQCPSPIQSHPLMVMAEITSSFVRLAEIVIISITPCLLLLW